VPGRTISSQGKRQENLKALYLPGGQAYIRNRYQLSKGEDFPMQKSVLFLK